MVLPRSWNIALEVLEALGSGRDAVESVRQMMFKEEEPKGGSRNTSTPIKRYRGTAGITQLELWAKWDGVIGALKRKGVTLTNPGHALEGALSIREHQGSLVRHDIYVYLDVTWLANILKPLLNHKDKEDPFGRLSLDDTGILLKDEEHIVSWKRLKNNGILEPSLASVFWPDGLCDYVLPTLYSLGLIHPLDDNSAKGSVVLLRLGKERPKDYFHDKNEIDMKVYGNIGTIAPWAALSVGISAIRTICLDFPGLRWSACFRCPQHEQDIHATRPGHKLLLGETCSLCSSETGGLGADAADLLEIIDVLQSRGDIFRSTHRRFVELQGKYSVLRPEASRDLHPEQFAKTQGLSEDEQTPEVWVKRLDEWREDDFKEGKGVFKKKKRLFLDQLAGLTLDVDAAAEGVLNDDGADVVVMPQTTQLEGRAYASLREFIHGEKGSQRTWFDDGNWANVSPPTAEATPTPTTVAPTAAAAFGAVRDASVTRTRRRRRVGEVEEDGVASPPSRKKKRISLGRSQTPPDQQSTPNTGTMSAAGDAGDKWHLSSKTVASQQVQQSSRGGSGMSTAPRKKHRAPPYEKVFNMKGVEKARFCHNRKDAEDTYLPAEDVLYRLNDGAPWHGRLDLTAWGVDDDNMPRIATVVLANVDAREDTGGVTSLVLDKCWRISDEGMQALTRPFLDQAASPNRLEEFSAAGCSLLTNESAYCIHRAFGKLLSVDVSGTAITDDGIQLILGASKVVRSLGLRDLPGLTDRGLGAILQCIKRRRKLHSLSLCRSLRFTDGGLLSLLSAGGLLRTLDIHGCSQLSELCLMGLQRAAFTSTNLKTLDLRGMDIADIAFGWVAQGCKALESLNISRCPLLTDLALEYLAKGSGESRPTPLKALNVAGVGGFTDEGMSILMPRSGPTLQDITLDGATSLGDGTVRSIARHCPGLTSLSMVELTRTSDTSLRELGRRCPLLRLLDSSSNINILETSHRTRVPKLSGDGVRELSAGTPCLAVLRLNGACKISDDTLVAVGANCPSLEELCIRSCSLVTDVGLAAVARGCPKLRHLSVGGCVRVTDASVRVVAVRAGGALRVLDVTGCRRLTDVALKAIGMNCTGLESLTLQGCEQLSDDGVVALLMRCPNITALNLRAVCDLTEDVVAAVETHCRRLRRLNMEGIPQVSGSRVQLAGERLPLVAREQGTRLLRPCALPCRVFNSYIQKRVEWTAAAITVQRVTRGKMCRLRWERGEQRKAWAARVLKSRLSAVLAGIILRRLLAQRRAEDAAAKVIQNCACCMFKRREARAELDWRRTKRDAAIRVQSVVRGRLGRVTAKATRERRQKAEKNWSWMVRKFERHLHALGMWREFMAVLRCYFRLWRIARRHRRGHACRKVQRAWKRMLRRRQKREAAQAELERRILAARMIQRKWRSYFRWKWMMRDVRLKEQEFKRQGFVKENAQMEIAFWWRRVRVKHLKRTVMRQLIVAKKAVGVIKRAYRSYLMRTLVVRTRKKAIAMRCRWRRIYLGIKRLPRPEDAARIQMILRRFVRKRKRQRAATDIQRVYRGALARRMFVVKLARMYTTNAINIQRVGRGHIARRGEVRDVLEANHASRVITRALRTYIRNMAFQNMVKEARAKKVRFERLQREALLRQRAEATLRQAYLMNQQKAARSIQARWRRRQAARRREEERLLRIEMDQRLALDKKLRQKHIDELKKQKIGSPGKRVGSALSALGRKLNKLTAQQDPELATEDHIEIEDDNEEEEDRPKTPVVSLLDKVRGKTDAEKEKEEKEDGEVLANAILNHQTNSIRQEGICEIHITVGKKEQKAFKQAQDYLKATKQEYMTCVEGDLSGKKQLNVHIWLKTGQGDGVISGVRIQKAPMNHANSAIAKVRQKEARQSSHMLVGHNRCDLELMCKVISRTEGTAPAVDDIAFCPKKAGEAELLDNGYERLEPMLKAVGLGKGFLFMHRKTHKKRPKKLDVAKYRLRKSNWFTSRTAMLLEKYALTEEELVAIHAIFSETDFKGDSTMDIYSFFSEMGEVETQYGHWLLGAVGAGGQKTEIVWDQYLEVVCFFCMFSRREVLRFVFGALDPSMRGYLNENDFQKFMTAVFQHESGIPGNYPGKAKRGFAKLASSGTQLEFPQFEKLCAQFPRLPHPIYRLHTSIQKHNLGETFWDAKKDIFTDARRAVGVEKIH
eukprot:g6237.t1